MTCHHSPGDSRCGEAGRIYAQHSAQEEAQRLAKRIRELEAQISSSTPDASNYTIQDVERTGKNIVMRVRYPNCAKCEFEGDKVMVFLNVAERDVLSWRRIDPHFRAPPKEGKWPANAAPSPAARFPATVEGWSDAVFYARNEEESTKTKEKK